MSSAILCKGKKEDALCAPNRVLPGSAKLYDQSEQKGHTGSIKQLLTLLESMQTFYAVHNFIKDIG